MVHSCLSFLGGSKHLFLFWFSCIFSLSTETAKSIYGNCFLLIITRLGLLAGIWWSLCILKSQRILMRLILWNGFWFVHIPFGSMVEFQSLAQFPVNHPSSPVVPSFVLLLWDFSVFANYVTNHFVFVSILPTFTIILYIVDFRLNIIGPYGVVLASY